MLTRTLLLEGFLKFLTDSANSRMIHGFMRFIQVPRYLSRRKVGAYLFLLDIVVLCRNI